MARQAGVYKLLCTAKTEGRHGREGRLDRALHGDWGRGLPGKPIFRHFLRNCYRPCRHIGHICHAIRHYLMSVGGDKLIIKLRIRRLTVFSYTTFVTLCYRSVLSRES
jgi:hypothetical protein